MQQKIKHREIIYNGKSGIRSTFNSLGTQMDDTTQHGYEQYHSHEDYQLVYLQEGKIIVYINNVSHVYSSGDILFLGPKLPHKIESYNGMACKGILIQFKHSLSPINIQDIADYHFIFTLLQKSLGGLLFHSGKSNKSISKQDQGDCQLLNMFISIHQAEGIQRLCFLLNLLDMLGRKLETSTTISYLSEISDNESLDIMVKKCKHYINIHYQSDISLSFLSSILGANTTALCRKFKEETGETIFQYLTHLRIEAASKMLRTTKRSISEIAYHCGFNTLPHFNRKFKELMGMSPKDFRKEK